MVPAKKKAPRTRIRTVTVERVETQIECAECGRSAWVARSDARFCGDRCRAAAKNRAARERKK